ncbi:hypothetical protein V8J88_04085 [Massilia sp. W12]|uniref:Tse2 family ADP-ribosyltransferase toxin n=1 Tax=Massilia sp. W12 TaxID=3126507 RepID=UPI0030CFE68D
MSNAVKRIVEGRTQEVLYIYQPDVDIFRAGKEIYPGMTKLRYEEDDRPPPKSNDILTYLAGNVLKVKAGSGGISLFDGMNHQRKMGRSDRWWCIPKGSQMPKDIIIAKDAKPNSNGLTHYSIEPAIDMPLSDFVEKLKAFAEFMYKVSNS